MGIYKPRDLKSIEPGALDYRRINQAIGEAAFARNEASQRRYAIGRPGNFAPDGGAWRFRVKGVYSTYLVCRSWDGDTEDTTDVYVAKPPHLRWYPYDWPGMTIIGHDVTFVWSTLENNIDGQRTASQTDETHQVEIIVPVWQWGLNDSGFGTGVLGGYDEIWADTPAGGTGVVTAFETAYTVGGVAAAAPAPVGTVLTLMDDNRNGRYWEQIG